MEVAVEGPSTKIATVEAIRSHFPALLRRHQGSPVAYFDGPGGTQVPQSVVDSVTDYLLHHNANTCWAYPRAARQTRLSARRAAPWLTISTRRRKRSCSAP